MPQAVTAKMVLSWRLHRDICVANGIDQSVVDHRAPVGTSTPDGTQTRNKRFRLPADRQTSSVTTFKVWAVWKTKVMRGNSSDSGDSQASLAWIGRSLVQFPSIDDTGALVTVQDEDWLIGHDGTTFRLENPIQSEDGAFWTCDMVTQR